MVLEINDINDIINSRSAVVIANFSIVAKAILHLARNQQVFNLSVQRNS